MQKNIIKNINLYQINTKFNRNLALLNSNKYQIFMIPENYSIHKYAMTNTHINPLSIFIFNSSFISEEIKQFIYSTHEKLNICILTDHDSFHLGDGLRIKYIKEPEYLINKTLYINNNNTERFDRVVYFHSHNQLEPHSKLLQLLYPNTKMNINIFDAHNIKHPLSIGYLDEIDKKNILYSSKYYIHDKSNYYLAEALCAGCLCLNLDCDIDIETQINNANNIHYNQSKIFEQMIDYNNFIEDAIL